MVTGASGPDGGVQLAIALPGRLPTTTPVIAEGHGSALSPVGGLQLAVALPDKLPTILEHPIDVVEFARLRLNV